MEIRVNTNIKLESKIPFTQVTDFSFVWRPNQHALLHMNGYFKSDSGYAKDILYDEKIKIWLVNGDIAQTLFYGYVKNIIEETTGNVKKVYLEAQSGSCMLDQYSEERSFQAVAKTYADIVKETVENNGGKIVSTEGNETSIGKPLIQYRETAWKFGIRLASHLGSCVVANIISDDPTMWFGMRKGVSIYSAVDSIYTIKMQRVRQGTGDKVQINYEIESKEFYMLGDRISFFGQWMTVFQVSAFFQKGDLLFRYLLKESEIYKTIYQKAFSGLVLTGTVVEIKQEQVKIALDIDGGNSTGNFFYDWYPETGNALYAMPEIGASVSLYIRDQDEREGFLAYSFLNHLESRQISSDKYIKTVTGNFISLYTGEISFWGQRGNITMCDDHISLRSVRKLHVSAASKVEIAADEIIIKAPNELSICQG